MKIVKTNSAVIAVLVFVVACAQQEQAQRFDSQEPSSHTQLETGKKNETHEAEIPVAVDTLVKQQHVRESPSQSKDNKVKRRENDLQLMGSSAQLNQPALIRAPAAKISRLNDLMGDIRSASESLNRENYAHFEDNAVKLVQEQPVSTFSIDVDSGSYANVRRHLRSGQLPAADVVRTEELINYFSYDYPINEREDEPFALHREIAPSPWNENRHLLHIGIKGYDLPVEKLPPANLVFLLDVSGSMQSADKIELLKSSFKLLVERLSAEDRVSIVVYAGASGVVLNPTSGSYKADIISSLQRLRAGGSTNGASGIRLAYTLAEQAFIKGGINRVLLATDGDFNVGTTNIEQLKSLIKEKRKTGIALSTLGFGTGNYNDHLMEQLADIGNGNYAYIDTLHEAQKVLIDEMSSTMMTIAADVKIQIEFNPALVSEYRLLGYENRMLRREEFNNDKVDAGDIGAGHTVTALYEVSLKGQGNRIDPLRYQSSEIVRSKTDELAFLRLRYKQPGTEQSKLLEWAINENEINDRLSSTSNAFRFAAAVAAFAQHLRGGKNTDNFDYPAMMALANSASGEDRFGYRSEFVSLLNLAKSLSHPQRQAHLVNK